MIMMQSNGFVWDSKQGIRSLGVLDSWLGSTVRAIKNHGGIVGELGDESHGGDFYLD